MFTGIITHTTEIIKQQREQGGLTLAFRRPKDWKDLALGESVATNGVCLTVTAIRPGSYDCHLMPETLRVSAFGRAIPKEVNLERSLSAAGRFGGHFVQGHVDGIGTITEIDQADGYYLTLTFPARHRELVIMKGSITINGVSLTITEITRNMLRVGLIPHTLEHTTLDSLKSDDKVNLEFDMIGKYVARIMEARNAKS